MDFKTGPSVIVASVGKTTANSNVVDVTVEIKDLDFKDLLQRKFSGLDLFIMGQITTKEREGLQFLIKLDTLLRTLATAKSGEAQHAEEE